MKNQLRLQSCGAALVVLLLIAMYFVQLPEGLAYPGLEILRGDRAQPAAQQAAYLHAMQILFALDGVFLAAQVLAWTGIAQVVRARAALPGMLALILGLSGVMMDLTENSIIWAALNSLQAGHLPASEWLIAWKTIHHLSYLLPMLAAVTAGSALWGPRTSERLACLVGLLFSALALCGLYLPELAPLADVWYIAWFASAAFLLWDSSNSTKFS
jgi:hypothetical protein